jgi:hypothetical protein
MTQCLEDRRVLVVGAGGFPGQEPDSPVANSLPISVITARAPWRRARTSTRRPRGGGAAST